MDPSRRATVSRCLALIALAFASVLGVWSCARDDAAPARPRDAAKAVRQVRLGSTTPRTMEERFGVADEDGPDGALVYRFGITRRHGTETLTEVETVTFHFTKAVLSRVCRTRS